LIFSAHVSQIFCQLPRTFPECTFTPQGTNTALSDPNPFINPSEIAGYERYLARSIQMTLFGITALNTSDPLNSFIQSNGSICSNPCTQDCQTGYCCTKYNEDINMLANINAAYVMQTGFYIDDLQWAASDQDCFANDNVSGALQKVNCFQLLAISRIPQDINLAYDKRGLRRPIIDAFIKEDVTAPVNTVKIPKKVIESFINEMGNSDLSYYRPGGVIANNLAFNLSRISWTDIDGGIHLDVNKIEGRMWLYFLCKQYIDMGYTSVNMSQANVFFNHTSSDINIPTQKMGKSQSEKELDSQIYGADVKLGYYNLYRVCQKIRNYAFENNKFFLIWNQSDRIYYAYDAAGAKELVNGKPKYIFDFNSVAARFREVDDAHLNEARNMVNSNTRPAMTAQNFNSLMPNCSNSCLKAVADPGSGTNYERNAEGNTPSPWINRWGNSQLPNGIYKTKQPTYLYFDGGEGRHNSDAIPANRCTPYSVRNVFLPPSNDKLDNHGAWGNDDERWFYEFSNKEGDPCTIQWLTHHYTNVRTFDNSDHVYFAALPGRLTKRLVFSVDGTSSSFNNPYTAKNPTFRLAEHPTIIQAIQNDIWKVNDVTTYNSINVTNHYNEISLGPCTMNFGSAVCYGTNRLSAYTFTAVTPDKSSIYTWHIKWNDGSWEPYTYGTSRYFRPNREGAFTVFLAQDNMGLAPSKNGSAIATVEISNSAYCQIDYNTCQFQLIEGNKNPVINENYIIKSITEQEKVELLDNVNKQRNQVDRGNDSHKEVKPVENIYKALTAKIYPQPVTNQMTLDYELPSDGDVELIIFNALGASIEHKKFEKRFKGFNTEKVDCVNLAAGVYFVHLKFKNEAIKALKFIKN
jgi:Secretion system C-terminal sorting domain